MKLESSNGVLEFGEGGVGNALIIDAKDDDPAEVRGGRPAPGILFKISGDLWMPDPNDPTKKIRFERVFVALGTDDSGAHGGQFQIQAMEPGKHGDEFTRKLLTVDTRQILCHVPLVALAGVFDTERKWPWEEDLDPTHGIPAGDFAAISALYGFPSEDQQPYTDGRLTWGQVIEAMDRRDDYRHFPKQGPPPSLPSPGPPPIDDRERAERVLDVETMTREFVGMDLNNVDSYLRGRSSLHEFHDENAARYESHDAHYHRPGRPY